MRRVVMLKAVIISWRDRVPGVGDIEVEGRLVHKAPAIGEVVDVPEDVLVRLDDEAERLGQGQWWAPALPDAKLGEQPEPKLATAEGRSEAAQTTFDSRQPPAQSGEPPLAPLTLKFTEGTSGEARGFGARVR